MTTEAKLKKLEEDQIIMEDQNCKLAKVRPPAPRRGAEERERPGACCSRPAAASLPPAVLADPVSAPSRSRPPFRSVRVLRASASH